MKLSSRRVSCGYETLIWICQWARKVNVVPGRKWSERSIPGHSRALVNWTSPTLILQRSQVPHSGQRNNHFSLIVSVGKEQGLTGIKLGVRNVCCGKVVESSILWTFLRVRMDVPLCGSYIKNDDAMWVNRYERSITPTVRLSWESRTYSQIGLKMVWENREGGWLGVLLLLEGGPGVRVPSRWPRFTRFELPNIAKGGST